ncbi:MAG: hypothetical protein H7Y41_03080 [Hyphomonadaceae bacterium]|nr:hypothetical protein [Clostridia bacterium]
MERKMSFDDVVVFDAVTHARNSEMLDLYTGTTGGGFRLSCEGFSEKRFLCMDIELLEDHAQPFYLLFKAKGSAQEAAEDFCVTFGVHPRLPMTFVFDFNWFDSQNLFPYRTTGRQKLVIHGKPNIIQNMSRMTFFVKESFHTVHIRVSNLRLLDDEPIYLQPQMDLLDEMGQYVPKTWIGKQPSIEAMVTNLNKQYSEVLEDRAGFYNPKWSRWGGWLEKKLTSGSGLFATHFDGRRHWLVDPDGYAFFSVGPDCVGGDTKTRIDVMRHALRWVPNESEYPEAITLHKNTI